MKKNKKAARLDKPVQPDIRRDQDIIAICAYHIWEKEGRPEGKQEVHWLQAETQMREQLAARG